MNCHDVDLALIELEVTPAATLPPQAEEHVRGCKRCQELIGVLNTPTAAGSASLSTLQQIESGIAADLRPVWPMLSSRYQFASFAGIFGSLVAFGVYRMGAFAIAVMSPLQAWTILSALTISSGLTAYSLTKQMVPGSRHRLGPRLLPGGILVVLAITISALFQFRHGADFWAGNWSCVRAGTPFGVLAAIPFWLVLRRGAVLSPGITGAATGLLAGLVGTGVLEIHCPNLDAGHILVSHLGVALLCAGAGLVIGLGAEIIGRRSFDRSRRCGM